VELTNIKRDFQLDAALKRFNEMKDTPEPVPTSALAPAPALAPVADVIVPTEHKKAG
jgi:hypothetical protein